MSDDETKHTPGPWDYVPGNEHHGPYVTSDYGSTICDCYVLSEPTALSPGMARKPVSFMHEMAEPNARLIAAAPDLLVQVKGLLGLANFLIHAVDVDTERTKVVLRKDGEAVAEVPIAVVLENSKAAVAKAEGRPA